MLSVDCLCRLKEQLPWPPWVHRVTALLCSAPLQDYADSNSLPFTPEGGRAWNKVFSVNKSSKCGKERRRGQGGTVKRKKWGPGHSSVDWVREWKSVLSKLKCKNERHDLWPRKPPMSSIPLKKSIISAHKQDLLKFFMCLTQMLSLRIFQASKLHFVRVTIDFNHNC